MRRNHQGKDNVLLFPLPTRAVRGEQEEVRCRERLRECLNSMSARRHERQTRTSDSGHGVLAVWLLSVVLAVLRLTVAGYWSWWRVMLPLLAFLGQRGVSSGWLPMLLLAET
jgi:hypothetical protein